MHGERCIVHQLIALASRCKLSEVREAKALLRGRDCAEEDVRRRWWVANPRQLQGQARVECGY